MRTVSKRTYRVTSMLGLNNGTTETGENIITLSDLFVTDDDTLELVYSLRECDLGIDGIIDMNVNETFSYKCHRESHCLMMISRIQ